MDRNLLLCMLSHELRTPLTALQIQTQMLQKLLEDPEDLYDSEKKSVLKKCAAQILRETQRQSELIGYLFDLSRLDLNLFSLKTSSFDLSQCVLETCDRMEGIAQQNQCAILTDVPQSCIGNWDRIRIEQVLINLLSNAIKHGNSRPIRVSLSILDASSIRLAVQDQGVGIEKKDQERIFHRYERAINGCCDNGVGLGLYITSEIIKAQGGSIHLESQPGLGTQFTVILPRTAPSSRVQADSSILESHPESPTRMERQML